MCLVVNAKEDTVKQNKKTYTDTLHKVFNSDQSLQIGVESIKSSGGGDRTEVSEQLIPTNR